MASVYDVLTGLTETINSSIVNAGITNKGYIRPGWPNMPELTKQMEQVPEQYYVSIYPLSDETNTTRFFPSNLTGIIGAVPTLSLTASVSSNVITFGGTPQGGVNIGVDFSPGALYQTTSSDTLATIATNVAAALNLASGIAAAASGDTISVTGVTNFTVNLGLTALGGSEVLRTIRNFQISIWTPSSNLRETIAEPVRAGIALTYFLQFPDKSYGRLLYKDTPWADVMERESIYFAHMIVSVEWGTFSSNTVAQIVLPRVSY